RGQRGPGPQGRSSPWIGALARARAGHRARRHGGDSVMARPRTLAQTEALSDAELLARLAAGQLGALGDLYDRYHVPVRTFVARATGDAHDVDDIVHATFL